jgi:hypothetical protein
MDFHLAAGTIAKKVHIRYSTFRHSTFHPNPGILLLRIHKAQDHHKHPLAPSATTKMPLAKLILSLACQYTPGKKGKLLLFLPYRNNGCVPDPGYLQMTFSASRRYQKISNGTIAEDTSADEIRVIFPSYTNRKHANQTLRLHFSDARD